MMSDHNSSDLAPQRQEMSVENVSSGLQKKTDSSHQELEFLFSPLIEEYYTPAHGHAEDNNNDQAPNASFQEAEFINPFCTRRSPLAQFIAKSNHAVQTRRQLATDPEMCMFALMNHLKLVAPWKAFGFSLPTQHTSLFQSISMGRGKNGILLNGSTEEGGFMLAQPEGFVVDPDHPGKKSTFEKALYGLKQLQDPNRFENVLMGEMKFFVGLKIHSPKRKALLGGITVLGDKASKLDVKKQYCTAMSSAKGRVRVVIFKVYVK
ncbi:hypothetical protein Tco_0633177 [Tanacetum coccineum]